MKWNLRVNMNQTYLEQVEEREAKAKLPKKPKGPENRIISYSYNHFDNVELGNMFLSFLSILFGIVITMLSVWVWII